MAGAASRGLCYLGALQHLYDKKLLDDLEMIAGVSIGSFIAVCLVVGFTPKEMFEILLYKDTKDFKDTSIDHAINQGSILKGDKYKTWVWEIISRKVDPLTTFLELYKKFNKKLMMTATCLQEGLVIFSTDKTPDMPIFYAILSSMAIPFIFPGIIYENKNYYDGGVLDNFPVTRLEGDDILGLRVTSKEINVDYTNVFMCVAKLFQLVSRQMRKLHGEKGEIIVIDARDYNFVDFELSMDDKLTLYYRGYESVTPYVYKQEEKKKMIIEEVVRNVIDEIIKKI